MCIATVAGIKIAMGIPAGDTSKDLLLSMLVDGINSAIAATLHRNLALTTYVEYYSGDNTPILILNQYPAVSIVRVCVDENGNFGQTSGAFPAENDLVAGVDYSLMAGMNGIGSNGCLRRIGGTWYQRPRYVEGKVALQPGTPAGNILVNYTAGFTTIPASIQMAANQAIIEAYNRMQAGGMVASESYQGASQSYFSPELLLKVFGSINQILGAYKSLPV